MISPAPEAIKSALDRALDEIRLPGPCVLLDYPEHANLGDHLIWMGEVFYLTLHRGVRLSFVSSAARFPWKRPPAFPEKTTILLSGGGNLGDLWPGPQMFRERIVAQYQDRPIVIFPQSVCFRNPANLARAAAVFNAHPNLTIFVRDRRSLSIAAENFPRCRVLLAPDVAFHLAGMLELACAPPRKDRGLYHYREDQEQPPDMSPQCLGLEHLEIDDWITWRRSRRDICWMTKGPFRRVRAHYRFFADMMRQPAARIRERSSEREWLARARRSLAIDRLPDAALHRKSWSMIHAGVYQFRQYPAIVTNRLHGHILCVLLGIPHLFLPNTYHKNESFFRTWTYTAPGGAFVSEPRQAAAQFDCLCQAASSTSIP